MQKWRATREEAGVKLGSFISARLQGALSQKKIKAALERNACEVNGVKERFASFLIKEGDWVTFQLPPQEEDKTSLAPPLFEDEALFVYNKPPYITSEELLARLQKERPQLKLLHRLDRDTSGVLVCIKNESVQKMLIEQFRRHEVEKHYVAIVDGSFIKKEGIISNHLAKKGERGGRPFWGKSAHGKPATTKWRVEEQGKEASLLSCQPLTGRTHQLRVHLSEMGHPILGDTLYGEHLSCSYLPPRCMLHAATLTLSHPETGERITFSAPLPDDMKAAVITLRLHK